ncbi:recombinase family protein [Cyanobium sp. PCC 7001]|uniref:recombinase family protein n=1 Tax=Cyanobium sp. PCC 7001 TaxID=180281 RepID=UPI001CED48DF|nr:recombinase family protein [Cyanobium sp. PCC 7001]
MARLISAGIPRERVVVEVASASKGRQTKLRQLFDRARRGEVSEIWAIRQDRLQRTRSEAAALWELIDQYGVAFRFLDEAAIDPADPSSCLQAQILGAFAQHETQMLSRRVRNALAHQREQGKHHGRPPWGYLAKEGRLVPDPESWDKARAVIETYLATGSSTAARRKRYELDGKPWGISAFARWITSPNLRGAVVYGLRTPNPEIIWGQHPPLVESHEWEAIAALRQSNRTNGGAQRKASRERLGTGLFVCEACGRRMHLKRRPNGVVLVICRQIRGAGCPVGHRNHLDHAKVPNLIRRAIGLAAVQIADQAVPHELPEPVELVKLREEAVAFERLGTPRARRQAEEVREEVARLEETLHRSSEQRQEAITSEVLRLASQWAAPGWADWRISDQELRAVALKYGLQFFVSGCHAERFEFQRLGVDGYLGSMETPVEARARKDSEAGYFTSGLLVESIGGAPPNNTSSQENQAINIAKFLVSRPIKSMPPD